jgi:hypothetical protein
MDAIHRADSTEIPDCGLTTEGPRRLDRIRIPRWNSLVRRVRVYRLFLLQLDPGAQGRARRGLVSSVQSIRQQALGYAPWQGPEARVMVASADCRLTFSTIGDTTLVPDCRFWIVDWRLYPRPPRLFSCLPGYRPPVSLARLG